MNLFQANKVDNDFSLCVCCLLILCTDCNIYYLVMYIFCNTYYVRNILYGCVIYFHIYNYAESSFHRRLCVDLLPSLRRDLNDVMDNELDERGVWYVEFYRSRGAKCYDL